jgi:GDP-4-dehydro-6-deoxy-D-mannose reductase
VKILVTGAAGFVGSYLLRELAAHGHNVIATSLNEAKVPIKQGYIDTLPCDLTHESEVHDLVTNAQPDAVIHLAAFSDLGKSWQARSELLKTNVDGTRYLAEACLQLSRPVTFLLVSTGAVYSNPSSHLLRANEATLPQPISPYAHSKLVAEHLLLTLENENFRPYIARPFNHTGVGQTTNFVCPAFAHRIAQATDGSVIDVGNLDVIKDFTDVKDIVRAYRMIIEQKPKQNLFVLGSGESISIRQVFKTMLNASGKRLEPKIQSELKRQEHGPVISDSSLARDVLGWTPELNIFETLTDLSNSFKA